MGAEPARRHLAFALDDLQTRDEMLGLGEFLLLNVLLGRVAEITGILWLFQRERFQ